MFRGHKTTSIIYRVEGLGWITVDLCAAKYPMVFEAIGVLSNEEDRKGVSDILRRTYPEASVLVLSREGGRGYSRTSTSSGSSVAPFDVRKSPLVQPTLKNALNKVKNDIVFILNRGKWAMVNLNESAERLPVEID